MGIYRSNNNDSILSIYEAQHLDSLNEVYFGDDSIQPLLTQLAKFRSKWIGKPYNKNINVDGDLIKFSRLVESKFGFYRFALSVDPSPSYNAYVMNVGFMASDKYYEEFGKGLKVYKGSDGFHYDKNAGVTGIGVILYGLLQDEDFTNREIMAILLHEIGHTFTDAVLNVSGVMTSSSYLTKIFSKINGLVQKQLESGDKVSDDKVDKDMSTLNITKAFSSLKQGIKNLTKFSVNKITDGIKRKIRRDNAGNMQYYDYTNEKFADTFASMYGYSVDLNEALGKLDSKVYSALTKDTVKPKSLKFYSELSYYMVDGYLGFLLGALDPHPMGATRIKTQIDYLNRTLKDTTIDPKMKVALQKQLDQYQEILKQSLDYESNPDSFTALKAYYAWLYKHCGGDLRETQTSNTALFDAIDAAYEDKS